MGGQGNSKVLKENNRKIIIKSFRDIAPVSRTKLAKYTKLSHTTISTITDELINENLIVKVGEGKSRGGRRPELLGFNNKKYYFLSVDLAVDYIYISLLNLNFEELISKEKKIEKKNINKEHIIKVITDLSNSIIEDIEGKILGMTIGVSGIIDKSMGKIINSAALNLEDLNIKKALKKSFKFPVFIENDANLSALAEKYIRGVSLNNFIYIFIGPSIGGGIVIDDKIYRGNRGSAGEIGHTIVKNDGPLCFCGNKGCLISVLDSFIPIKTTEEFLTAFNNIDKNKFYNSKFYREFCQYLSLSISNYIKLNDPQVIIIGGDIIKIAPERFFSDIKKLTNNKLIKGINKNTQIIPSSIEGNSIILGGGYLTFQYTLL